MVNQAFDDPDIEEVITNVDTKQKTVKVCDLKIYCTKYYTKYYTQYSTKYHIKYHTGYYTDQNLQP